MRKLLQILLLLTAFGISAEETIPFNFTIIPYVNLIPGDHNTVLATGFISSDIYSLNGVQFAPVFATTKGDMIGVQTSGVFNMVEGEAKGFQHSGVFNMADKDMLGAQLAGVFNSVDGSLRGIQSAGVFNLTQGESYGFQTAGVFNVAEGKAYAAQIAGVYNISGELKGTQIAGVFNIADSINGAQISVVNYAGNVNGLQLGVVNINSGEGKALPIGVINIYENGIKDIFAYTDRDSSLIYGIETGSDFFYTQLYTGTSWENRANSKDRFVGYGFGVRSSVVDLVLGAKNHVGYYSNYVYPTPTGKATLSLRLGSVSIFGGISGDLAIDNYNNKSKFFTDENFKKINDGINLYYTWIAGVKIHL